MLLFLDVDGPLIPFGADRAYPVYGHGVAAVRDCAESVLLNRVDPALGRRLAALGCELVWATTWMEDANDCLAPWLGLPPLPVVQWPDEDEPPGLLHWKTRPLVAWAAGRPFIWVDDEITEADRAWVAVHHRGPALLHRVDHRHGLAEADFTALRAWLASQPG
ncbi:HAD domain-containing protein [Streptomyces sp. NPDC005573]|uniref:HAD domain-containing protein n=1 Tax=Streptomyces sp. NPDC005573 TaxID=3156890 RepID=UPI0033BB3A7E